MLDDAVHDGVAEVHVGRSHVDFGSQHSCAFVELSGVHPLEEVKVFFYAAVAVGAFGAGHCRSAFLSGDLFGCLIVDISLSFFDKTYREIVELREIVRRIVFAVAPVETEPVDIFTDRVNVFDIFFYGVGVVESQVTGAAEFFGDAEVHADGFGVSDVEIAVRLGRKAGVEPSAVLTGLKVVPDDLFNKVESFLFGSFCVVDFCHEIYCWLAFSAMEMKCLIISVSRDS